MLYSSTESSVTSLWHSYSAIQSPRNFLDSTKFRISLFSISVTFKIFQATIISCQFRNSHFPTGLPTQWSVLDKKKIRETHLRCKSDHLYDVQKGEHNATRIPALKSKCSDSNFCNIIYCLPNLGQYS